MCRLCAIVGPLPHKKVLMHELLLRSCPEENGQKDGWGVASPSVVLKGSDYYLDTSSGWVGKLALDVTTPLIGHVRKASSQTGRTALEAHPYVYAVGNERLTFAHNGWIAGMSHSYVQGTPDTDSYRAGKLLADRLSESDISISADLFSEWLSSFEIGTQFAMLLLWKDSVYIARGTKPLHISSIDDTYVIGTSKNALDTGISTYLALTGRDVKVDAAAEIPQNTLLKLSPGAAPVVSALDHTFRSVSSTYGRSAAAAIIPVNNGNSQTLTVNQTFAPRVTTKRDKNNVATETYKQRRAIWREFASVLAPLRSGLLKYWVASMLMYEIDPTRLLLHITQEELEMLPSVLLSTDEDGEFASPLGPAANRVLNFWNHNVNAEQDIVVYDAIFGKGSIGYPFWVEGSLLDEEEAQNSWVESIQARISAYLSK